MNISIHINHLGNSHTHKLMLFRTIFRSISRDISPITTTLGRTRISFYSDTSNSSNDTNSKDNNNTQSQESSIDPKYKELHKHYLTVLADMENLRTRTRREVEQASVFSITKFAKDMLSILDILQSALGSVPIHLRPSKSLKDNPQSTTSEQNSNGTQRALNDLYCGLEMTYSELVNALKRHGVEPFDSLYTIFDPNLHMALYDVPKSSTQLPESVTSDETMTKHPIVIDEQKRGFKIKDRILRPANVGIAR